MDADRFDTLARSLTIAGSRRRVLGVLSGVTLGALTPLLERADGEAGKRKKNKKKKKRRTTTPDPVSPPPPPPHPRVTCEMRDDPVCSSDPQCQCATTGLIPETGSNRHCGSYGGSDPCTTAPRCPCPEGYICDLGGFYTFGTCPDGGGRCAKNCGG